ncbi:hypothetical protein DAPPUDRAFT_256620 [Daphnia pulex]|uniref:COPA/B second beta-propeller domain-containing protein n=1 Tax=Daphnia pulex TaxID=6669 RepID=E9HBS7_DAPPU|nr:hypothetical protein DAPPUDRAFT_256620 [Daphnia pulex]|eukprot:EFX70770.1 hypothetical protein DAPPUDRAFT_256620 [Daphnia pulex]
MGGRYLPWPLQQCFLRLVPSLTRADPFQLGGQEYPCVGPHEKDVPQHFPSLTRPFLGYGCLSDFGSICSQYINILAQFRNDDLQTGAIKACERTLRRLDLTTSKDTGLLQLRGNARTLIHSILHNLAEQSALIIIKKEKNEVKKTKCRHIVWSVDTSHVTLLGKHVLTTANRQLEVLCTIQENPRLKTAPREVPGVLIYTTSHHIKYSLINGDHGIIRILDLPVYLLLSSFRHAL